MARRVRIPSGVNQIALPDGRIYSGLTEVVLSDEHWAKVRSDLIDRGVVVDLGVEPDPSVTSDAELQAHAEDVLLHSSGQEIAYSENASGTTQALTTAMADVTGLTVVVPVNPRPVWVEAEVMLDPTALPAAGTPAAVALQVLDQNSTIHAYAYHGLDNLIHHGGSAYRHLSVRGRVGPVASELTLRLQALKAGDAAFAASLVHGAIAPAFKSWITATAR